MPQLHRASASTHDGDIQGVYHHRLGKALRALNKWKAKCGIEKEANQELGKRVNQWKLAFEEERMKREEAELQLYKIKRNQRHSFSELRKEKTERLIIEEHLQTTINRVKQLENDWTHKKNKGESENVSTDRPLLSTAPAFSIDKLNGYHLYNEKVDREHSSSEDNSIVQQFASPGSESICTNFSNSTSSSRCRISVKNKREILEDAKFNPACHDEPDMPRSRGSSVTSNIGGETLCYSSESTSKSGSQPGRFSWNHDNNIVGDERPPPPFAEGYTTFASNGVVVHPTHGEQGIDSSLYVNHERDTNILFESSYISPVTSNDGSIANENNPEVCGQGSCSVVKQPVIVLPEDICQNLGSRNDERSHEAASECSVKPMMVTSSSEACQNPGRLTATLDDEIIPLEEGSIALLSPLTWDDGATSDNGFKVKGELNQRKKPPSHLLDRLLGLYPSTVHSTTACSDPVS